MDTLVTKFPVMMTNVTHQPKTVRGLLGRWEEVEQEYGRSCDHLTSDQATHLRTYADVFATEHDQGCAGLMEHHIHAGGHRLIKQPPRRVGPRQRKIGRD